ncbi:MMPL family transporter [Streptomyces sp. NPDC058001]|uniref:MMPL family transporter n=1 Tax=Streptomyces sp. NPDC058001 TaxID=3346300 RepID=UPI0036EFD2E2
MRQEPFGGFDRRSRRRARLVVALTCLLGSLACWYAVGLTHLLSPGGWTPPAADSVRAEALLASEFHAGPPQLILHATTPDSVDAPEVTAAGRDLTRRVAEDQRVAWVNSYWQQGLPSLRTEDRHSALVLIRLQGGERATRDAAGDIIDRFTGTRGPLRVSASGAAAVMDETEKLSEEGMRFAEFVAVPLVLLILLWVLGSVTAALLPVVVGVVAVAATTAVLRLLSTVTEVSLFALNITTALGFGLAVDFSLLLVSRYREELAGGGGADQALRRTLRDAGRTVVFSAATIAASLSALLLFPLPLLRSLAYGGVTVVCASAAGALTVLPALLILLGERLDRWDVFARLRRPRQAVSSGAWFRLARAVMRRPVLVTVGALALLVLLAAPVTQVRFGMYDDRILPPSSPVAETSQRLRADFGSEWVDAASVVLPGPTAGRPGAETGAVTGPVTGAVPDPVTDPVPDSVLDAYARRLALVPGVRRVEARTGTYRDGLRSAVPDASSARFAGPGGTWLSVIPEGTDPLSPEGSRLAAGLRAVPAPGPVLVGGPGARLADTEQVLAGRLPLVVGVTVLAAFALLLAFTRSVLIPVKALLLNALGLAATSGVLVAVFQQGRLAPLLGDVTAGGVTDVVVPSLMFCVTFGLSMDYEVFLLSRIVEEHRRGSDTATAVAIGLQRTGRLFTSAALVFATVTAALALSSLVLLKLIGVGLAFAVLLDCTVIRALLVPAVMRLAGRANWWMPRFGRGKNRRVPSGTPPSETSLPGTPLPAAPMEDT